MPYLGHMQILDESICFRCSTLQTKGAILVLTFGQSYAIGSGAMRYKNLGGASGIVAYEFGEGEITVQFKDGMRYLFTDISAGAASITEMQRLASVGRGLNSYIVRFVRNDYARKW